MSAFKFIHAADIHLDSPLRGLSRYEGISVDEVRIATRTALNNLVDVAIEEQVAFIIIAGDLYDGDWQDFGTGLFLCHVMGRLQKAGIDVYILYGNHDAESVLTKKLPFPSNVYVFNTRKPTTFFHESTGVALHGWSYREKDTRENLAVSYPAAARNQFNIGVLHTAMGGRPPHAPYSPCNVQELSSKGYDYWALGHAHDFEIVSQSPLIIYPGNIQGRNIREVGKKGAVLVSVVKDQIVSTPVLLALDAIRWSKVEIDLSSVSSELEMNGLLSSKLLNEWQYRSDGRPLIIRVVLMGITSLHGELRLRRELLREDVRAIALAISDRLWIEKVQIQTEIPGGINYKDLGIGDELRNLLSEGLNDKDLMESLNTDLAEFFTKVPLELAADDEFLTCVRQGEVSGLITDAASALMTRLEEAGK